MNDPALEVAKELKAGELERAKAWPPDSKVHQHYMRVIEECAAMIRRHYEQKMSTS